MLSIYVCGAVITAFKRIKMLLLSVYFQILFIRRIQNRSPNLWFVEMIFNGISIEFVLFKNVLKSFSVYIYSNHWSPMHLEIYFWWKQV